MIDEDSIEKLHVKLEELRRLNKVSYRAMSEEIGYSGEGINKALKNHTLSIPQIFKIAEKFGFTQELGDLLPTSDNSFKTAKTPFKLSEETTIEDLAVLAIENWNELLEDKFFKLQVENYSLNKAIEMLKDRGVKA